MPRHLQSQIHSEKSISSLVWIEYNKQIVDLWNSTLNYEDFNDHLIREYNRKIRLFNQLNSLLFSPYDAGYRLIGSISKGLLLTGKLGAAAAFGTLANAAISGTGYVLGDVGSAFGAISLTVTSSQTIYPTGDEIVIKALADFAIAYDDVKSREYDVLLSVGAYDLGGDTLTAGVYKIGGIASMTSTLILDGQDDPNSFFLIQIVGGLDTTATVGNVLLINGAKSANVFWIAEGAVTTGANSHMEGTIFGGAAITFGANTTINGRAGSNAGAITLGDTTTITVPTWS